MTKTEQYQNKVAKPIKYLGTRKGKPHIEKLTISSTRAQKIPQEKKNDKIILKNDL